VLIGSERKYHVPDLTKFFCSRFSLPT